VRGRPSRSSGSEAYDLLLAAIDSGALPAGTRLREAELAERYGISRTPVREALKRLEAQGLVLHEPHHGAVVARLDYARMTELYHMREVLEGTAAGLAATHATPTEMEVLREMVERDRGLLDDPAVLAGTNRLFHRQVCLSARNGFLNTMLENLRISLALLAGTTLAVPEARDAEAAEAAARRHIRNAFKVRIGLSNGAP
jgi:DNA-binding GntR family transcriptional regulator